MATIDLDLRNASLGSLLSKVNLLMFRMSLMVRDLSGDEERSTSIKKVSICLASAGWHPGKVAQRLDASMRWHDKLGRFKFILDRNDPASTSSALPRSYLHARWRLCPI